MEKTSIFNVQPQFCRGTVVVSLTGLAAHGKAASNGTLGPSASPRMRTLLGEIESFMATISPIANA